MYKGSRSPEQMGICLSLSLLTHGHKIARVSSMASLPLTLSMSIPTMQIVLIKREVSASGSMPGLYLSPNNRKTAIFFDMLNETSLLEHYYVAEIKGELFRYYIILVDHAISFPPLPQEVAA